MRIKITERDAKSYVFGMLTVFIFLTIIDWEKNIAAFKAAFNDGIQNYEDRHEDLEK